jgi:hypothetical protein
MKYRSNISVVILIKLANNELKPSDPPAYMVFLLAVAAGLRRKEIDLLEWSAFRFKENVIRIEPTQFFHPKSEDSIGEIQVDPEIAAIFRQYHAMLTEGLRNLSPRRLHKLLVDCRSVKVKRLFLWFAEKHDHAWLKQLDRIDLGDGKRMLVRGGKLDPKFNITVPENIDADR